MSTNLEKMSTSELITLMALRCLMDSDVRNIAIGQEDMDFMTKLISDYATIDPQAFLGAQHMVDFLKGHRVGPREFAVLRRLCKDDTYLFVVLSRAEQLGIISRQDIQDRFDPNKPLRPFNFEMLDKEVNKRTSLFRPKTEE